MYTIHNKMLGETLTTRRCRHSLVTCVSFAHPYSERSMLAHRSIICHSRSLSRTHRPEAEHAAQSTHAHVTRKSPKHPQHFWHTGHSFPLFSPVKLQPPSLLNSGRWSIDRRRRAHYNTPHGLHRRFVTTASSSCPCSVARVVRAQPSL
jgi:hypothetical protein